MGSDEADLYRAEHDLVVEIDTDQTHGSKWARERDERTDVRMKARGLEVRRFTA